MCVCVRVYIYIVPSFLCVWMEMPRRRLQTNMLPREFLLVLLE